MVTVAIQHESDGNARLTLTFLFSYTNRPQLSISRRGLFLAGYLFPSSASRRKSRRNADAFNTLHGRTEEGEEEGGGGGREGERMGN